MKLILNSRLPRRLALMSAVLASTAMAASLSLGDINQRIQRILAPLNNSGSVWALKLSQLQVSKDRVDAVAGSALVDVLGKANQLRLEVNDASYVFKGDQGLPEGQGEFRLSTDLVKAFGRGTLDSIAEGLADIAKDMSQEFLEEYGPAAELDVKTEITGRDPQGHVTGVTARFLVTIDVSKLPAEKPISKVELRRFEVDFSASTTQLDARIRVLMNPDYEGFSPDGDGLKEWLEKLQSDDDETYAKIEEYSQIVYGLVRKVVDQDRTEKGM